MRGERYEIIEGKIQGKRSVGRHQNSWLKALSRWLGPRGEPRLELGVHVFGIMWNYFGIH